MCYEMQKEKIPEHLFSLSYEFSVVETVVILLLWFERLERLMNSYILFYSVLFFTYLVTSCWIGEMCL